MGDKEVIKKLENIGEVLLKQIEKSESPSYEVPVRNLNNIFFDKKTGTIKLGDKMSERQFLNIAHSRKFMQTVLVAAEIKKVIESKATVSIRDLYYALKHTIEGTNENTFEEQGESITPNETVLVRMNGELKLTTADEVVQFALKNGTVEIDEPGRKIISVKGIKVAGFDEKQKIREFESQYIIVHPPNETVKITTSAGRTVKVTKSHSIFTANDGKPVSAFAKDLKVGDYIALPRRIEILENKEPINLIYSIIKNAPEQKIKNVYLKADAKTINEILSRIGKEKLREAIGTMGFKNSWSDVAANWKHWKTLPIGLIKETNPNVTDLLENIVISGKGGRNCYKPIVQKDRSLGVVLGSLLSEGCLETVERKRPEKRISISNKSKEFLAEFTRAFEASFGECSSKKPLARKDGTFIINVGYDTLEKILEYGIGLKFEKAWDKEVPNAMLDAPAECIQAFLYSFRKGDGSRGARFEIRYHTTSEKLVNAITFLLLRQGLFPNIYEYKKKAPSHMAYEVRVGNRDYSKELSKTTGDYDIMFEKLTAQSSDRIPGIANIIEKARETITLSGHAHKELNFNQIKGDAGTSRPMLSKIITAFGPEANSYTEQLEEILQSDIYWDKIKSIEPAEVPEYTMDFTVKPVQNFIGGRGMMLLPNSDPCIEDIEASLDLLREELHLAASAKGIIAGDVQLRDGKDSIDLSKMGSGGWSVPSNVEPEQIEFKKVKAKYVLFIEKDAVWRRFNEDQFWKENGCIILTGRGQPGRGERRLAQRLNKEFKLPIYVLTDADPWGMYIYSVIKQGSISLSYSEEKLATPQAKFIGLTTLDVETYKIPKEVTIKLNSLDVKRLKEMEAYEWFQKKEWKEEFKNMKERAYKLELEALSKKGIRFITEKYVPEKLKNKDFLP